jgi:hypothetical protein
VEGLRNSTKIVRVFSVTVRIRTGQVKKAEFLLGANFLEERWKRCGSEIWGIFILILLEVRGGRANTPCFYMCVNTSKSVKRTGPNVECMCIFVVGM